jgi:hypothetical protein
MTGRRKPRLSSRSSWKRRRRRKIVKKRVQLRIRFTPKKFGVGCWRLARGGIRLLYSTFAFPAATPTDCLGIDDTQKIIQYSMKVYLLFHHAVSRRMPVQGAGKGALERSLLRRLESTVSGLSMTRCVPTIRGPNCDFLRLDRKCLIMFNWLTPLTSILAEHHASPVYKAGGAKAAPSSRKPLLHTFLHAPPPVLLELVQAIADDVSTCSKLGLFGRRTGERAGRFADWCWFASTLVDLVENSVELGMISNSQRTGELNSLASRWKCSKETRKTVESRLYTESMAGATAKSTPRRTKVDDRELKLLQKQAYWLQVQRTKLIMDLIFVCE